MTLGDEAFSSNGRKFCLFPRMDKFVTRLPAQVPTAFMHSFGRMTRRQFMAGKIFIFLNRRGPPDDKFTPPEKQRKTEKRSADSSLGRSYLLNEVKGDLFTCPPSTSLVHCISADARMGKGIAVQFKKRFGGVEDIKKQGQRPGGVAVLKREQRFIYNMVTKERSFHKPTYDSLRSSLQATKEHCVRQEVRELAMPKIGCGLDGLDWPRVSRIIYDVFKDSVIHITVYIL